MAHLPTAWLIYFKVDGADAAAARVKANGGAVVNGPMEVPGGDWILQCTDPQGGGVRAAREEALSAGSDRLGKPLPKRCALRSLAFIASTSRSRGAAVVESESISRRATAVTSSTAWLKAASLARDGAVKSAQLPDELQRRRTDLLVGGRWIEIEQCLDVAAHRGILEIGSRQTATGRRRSDNFLQARLV